MSPLASIVRVWLPLCILTALGLSCSMAFVINEDELLPEEGAAQAEAEAAANRAALRLDMTDISLTTDVRSADYDAVVVVTDKAENLLGENLLPVKEVIQRYLDADPAYGGEPAVTLTEAVASQRLIYATTGKLEGDENDVRSFGTAAANGVGRAVAAGSKQPLLVVAAPPRDPRYSTAFFVALLGALQRLYQPLSVRESGKAAAVHVLGVWHAGQRSAATSSVLRVVQALETGRIVARDICGSDPERMAPPQVEKYLRQVFAGTPVAMFSVSDPESIAHEFPLVAAVARASSPVERHQPRIIKLMYTGPGTPNRTLLLAGKGVTYDSGGADIKIMGYMVSMSRDKCGAAAVAGIIKALSILQPPNLRVVGALPMVRNSVGAEGYVSDEVIKARSGVRIRIGNTDAEGRLILADVLCRLKEIALAAPNPHIISIATLTGHAEMTGGSQYSMLLDNEPARSLHTAVRLQATGDKVADPFEISRLRREDFLAHKTPSDPEAELLSAVNKPSTRSKRGHQKPTAFLLQASGLDRHGTGSSHSLPFSHVDIAGPAMVFPKAANPVPLVAIATHFGLSSQGKRLVGLQVTEEGGEEKEETVEEEEKEAAVQREEGLVEENEGVVEEEEQEDETVETEVEVEVEDEGGEVEEEEEEEEEEGGLEQAGTEEENEEEEDEKVVLGEADGVNIEE